jgi:hypothetical protein
MLLSGLTVIFMVSPILTPKRQNWCNAYCRHNSNQLFVNCISGMARWDKFQNWVEVGKIRQVKTCIAIGHQEPQFANYLSPTVHHQVPTHT